MSDQKLRGLELRWKETGTVEDEAAYLLERVRVGDLPERGLVIAAGLGHEAAQRLAPAIGLGPFELLATPEAQDVSPPGRARVRAALAVAFTMSDRYMQAIRSASQSPSHRVNLDPNERVHCLRQALIAAGQWTVDPCGRHTEALGALDLFFSNDCYPDCCWEPQDYPGQLVGLAFNAIAQCAGRPNACTTWFETFHDLRTAREFDPQELVQAAERAIREDVIPWALGYADLLAVQLQSLCVDAT